MQQIFVGDRVRVVNADRPAPEDRSGFVGRNALVVQKLNVPWTPDTGSLWRIRFFSGEEAVFAENELALIDREGKAEDVDLTELRDTWGDAPRTVSMPFKRRFGAGSASAPAILGVLLFAIVGVLLVAAGLAEHDVRFGIAGGVSILIGLGAAAILVS